MKSLAVDYLLPILFCLGLSVYKAPSVVTLINPRPVLTAIGGGSYTAVANDWDGSDDYAERDRNPSDLDNNADGKKGIGSFWVKFDSTNGTQAIFNNTGDRFQIQKQPEGYFRIRGLNSVGTTILQLQQDTNKVTFITTATWYHVMYAYDLATAGQRWLYINNTEALDTGALTFTDDTIDYTVAEHAIFGAVGGGFHVNGCEADLYLNWAEVLDLSNSANRAKFISGGVPVDLGSTGQTPTGTTPIMFFKGDYNGVTTSGAIANAGNGGNFVKKGAGSITACSNHP